jgi:hypothetical protein
MRRDSARGLRALRIAGARAPSTLARVLLSWTSLLATFVQERFMLGLRSILALSMALFALAGCSKHETPHAESSSGGDHTARKVGHDIDEAADEASDEVKHVGNDRDEKADEAKDSVDEATGHD